MSAPKLYLASTSPRRKQLLAEHGYRFFLIAPNCEEKELPGESPRAMVKRLANEKAMAAFRLLHKKIGQSHSVLISADTTVVDPSGQGVLNKPVSKKDAERILKRISGRTHLVLTAFVLLESKKGKITKRVTHVVKTSVLIKKLTPAQIHDYIRSGEPMDKAGAYAAQGIGMAFISQIRGSYTNVVGLPMSELSENLKRHFGIRPNWMRS